MSTKVLITLATYNEAENIPKLIDAILEMGQDLNILVIDDNSPDGTGKLADAIADRDPRVRVLHRAGKEGLGTATVAGMRYAIDHEYEHVLNMDADFSHHPRYIPAILNGMSHNDVMIGSRYVPGGGVSGWPLRRKLMSRAINTYARCLLGIEARDTSGAFRCYRVSSLRKVDLGRIISRGYSFQEEILYLCRRAGCRIGETPIVFQDRRYGKSKINNREAVAALWVLFRLGVQRLCPF